jgi:uncharacterized damage-inducible protein DinB
MCEVDLSVFLGPAKILDGLTADQANAKPHQLPHSIADIVAHLCFWQEWFNAIEEAKRIAARSDALNDPILPPDVQNPVLARESRGSGILHAAVHNSHHLGQIITLRQLMGLWPPAAGSMTW